MGVAVGANARAIDWKGLASAGKATVATDVVVGGGDETSDEDLVFAHPCGLCVADDGSFFVLDGDGVIVAFAPDGTERSRISRKGEGPGELLNPLGIRMDSQGRLLVFELDNHRFSIFQTDGTFVKTIPFQGVVDDFQVAPDGGVVVLVEPQEMMRTGHKSLTQLVRTDADLAHPVVIDSLRAPKFMMMSNSFIVSTPSYTQMRMCLLGDGSIAWNRDDVYDIHVVGPDLKPRATLRRDVAPRGFAKADKEAYYHAFDSSGPEVVTRLRNEAEWPKYQPVIDGLFADGDVVIAMRDGPALDVFRADAFLGSVAATGFGRPRAIHDGRFYRISRDEDELPAVRVFRLEPAPR
jgi:hypothetical protein